MEKSLSQYADVALNYVLVSEQMSIKDCSILKLLELEKSLSNQGNMFTGNMFTCVFTGYGDRLGQCLSCGSNNTEQYILLSHLDAIFINLG